jgi:hypothetical protein
MMIAVNDYPRQLRFALWRYLRAPARINAPAYATVRSGWLQAG